MLGKKNRVFFTLLQATTWLQLCKNLTSPFHFFQVIKRANGVQYGLCAVVWTENVSRTHRVSQRLQVL